MYADNLNIYASHKSSEVIDARLCVAANAISGWCDAKNMTVAPTKSVATLITPDTRFRLRTLGIHKETACQVSQDHQSSRCHL